MRRYVSPPPPTPLPPYSFFSGRIYRRHFRSQCSLLSSTDKVLVHSCRDAQQNPTTHRLELKSINVSVPGRTSTSTFARQHRFTVPIPSDEDASWLDEVSRWWEGTAGEGEEKKEAESS